MPSWDPALLGARHCVKSILSDWTSGKPLCPSVHLGHSGASVELAQAEINELQDLPPEQYLLVHWGLCAACKAAKPTRSLREASAKPTRSLREAYGATLEG